MNQALHINWIELAISDRWPIAVAESLEVHTVTPSARDGCFAIALDGRWLSGCDGAVSCFDSKEAIGHFLELLNIRDVFDGTVREAVEVGSSELQCFKLNGSGIARCERCREGGKRGITVS